MFLIKGLLSRPVGPTWSAFYGNYEWDIQKEELFYKLVVFAGPIAVLRWLRDNNVKCFVRHDRYYSDTVYSSVDSPVISTNLLSYWAITFYESNLPKHVLSLLNSEKSEDE